MGCDIENLSFVQGVGIVGTQAETERALVHVWRSVGQSCEVEGAWGGKRGGHVECETQATTNKA
jgi:hypothetical protein